MIFGLYGAGGFGREAMPYVKHQNAVFIETEPKKDSVDGIPLLSEGIFFSYTYEKLFNVAIANSKLRQEIAERCIEHGAKPLSIYSGKTSISAFGGARDGIICFPFSTITTNVRIGKFFHLNMYSYVAHDCVIGDYVTFSPRVSCNGNVTIGDHVFVGTGAIIFPGIKIGDGARIGAGAVVAQNVPAGAIVAHTPSRIMGMHK